MEQQLQNMKTHFDKANYEYLWNEPCDLEDIKCLESKFGIALPEQVCRLYRSVNGIKLVNPRFEIYSLSAIRQYSHFLVFSCFDGEHEIGFDTREINVAGQWDIVNIENGYVVTHTIASFIFNKMLAWVERGRTVWAKEIYS